VRGHVHFVQRQGEPAFTRRSLRARQEITFTANKVFLQASSGQRPGGTAEVDWLGLFVSFVSFCRILQVS